MSKLNSLEALYIHELRDLHSAERQILEALPKLVKGAENENLRAAFDAHLSETKMHVERLDKVIEALGEKAKGVKCKGMEGLLAEGKELLEAKDKSDAAVIDAALIGAAQRVEHYEIAGYGTVMALAKQLGREDDIAILKETMEEEKAADSRLTELAERTINPVAA